MMGACAFCREPIDRSDADAVRAHDSSCAVRRRVSERDADVRVPSLTDAAESYVVGKRGDRMICSCPVPKGWCKHRQLVAQVDLLIKRCGEKHGTEGGVCRVCLVAIFAVAARKVAVREKQLVRTTRESTKDKIRNRKKKAVIDDAKA